MIAATIIAFAFGTVLGAFDRDIIDVLLLMAILIFLVILKVGWLAAILVVISINMAYLLILFLKDGN